jgi:hypothetical protein
MLRKLEWETHEFQQPDIYATFRAFNVAVTAWHLADWVWRELPPASRSRIGSSKKDFERFCPDLSLCRLIANGSKHGDRGRRHFNVGTSTKALADVLRSRCGEAVCGRPIATWTWRLTISDGEQEHAAAEVFARVLMFWRDLIDRELPAPA